MPLRWCRRCQLPAMFLPSYCRPSQSADSLIDANKGSSPSRLGTPRNIKILNSSRPSMRNMYMPITPSAIRYEAIWYQGESNARVGAAVNAPRFQSHDSGVEARFNPNALPQRPLTENLINTGSPVTAITKLPPSNWKTPEWRWPSISAK